MADFDDFGKGESKPFELKGEPLTREHLDVVCEYIKNQRGWPPEKMISLNQYKRAKVLAEKLKAGTATEEERLELSAITGV